MRPAYIPWSLAENMFSLKEISLATQIEAKQLRSAMQVIDFVMLSRETIPSEELQKSKYSYWDVLALTTFIQTDRQVCVKGEQFEGVLDTLSFVLPEQSYLTKILSTSELKASIVHHLSEENLPQSLSSELALDGFAVVASGVFFCLDRFVQQELGGYFDYSNQTTLVKFQRKRLSVSCTYEDQPKSPDLWRF